MILEKDYLPMFRESEANGMIGIKGYLYYFQDMTTHYLHNLGKGNDTLPEEDSIWLLGMKEDGSIAVQGMMKTRKE